VSVILELNSVAKHLLISFKVISGDWRMFFFLHRSWIRVRKYAYNWRRHIFKHCSCNSELSSDHSSLMMEAARTSETSVDNYVTRQYIPEDNSELHTRSRENLKSHIFLAILQTSLTFMLIYCVYKHVLAKKIALHGAKYSFDKPVVVSSKITFTSFYCTPSRYQRPQQL
jgi:hypothetical protein